MGIKNCF